MRLVLLITLLTHLSLHAQISVDEVGELPEKVSNNAVCEGFINGDPYVFSFAGIDSTLKWDGIHLRSFRYNSSTGKSIRIPNLPDTMGKVACGASRIGNIIYIIGGYHVFDDGHEISSRNVHRYDINQNQYLTDAKSLLVATDDHVQVVWRDSLIYVITGWNNVRNIPNVQIYDPTTNEWELGTPVPNNDEYKSFGASGVIIGDTIYYFGGAASTVGFPIQTQLRKGVINPSNPYQIEWSIAKNDSLTSGYRMASTIVDNQIHWIGGSTTTYNYDGVAYNGSGSVTNSNRDLWIMNTALPWQKRFNTSIPMDLRGIADATASIKYIAGGISENLKVSNKVLRLKWDGTSSILKPLREGIIVYPNPTRGMVHVDLNRPNAPSELILVNNLGQVVRQIKMEESTIEFDVSQLPKGIYSMVLSGFQPKKIQVQ